MNYRADIDGLRAIAIIAVVAAHVGMPGFSGGFIGVDAFFVISGFLITSLLREEQQTSGRINLFAFYARRARRLIPALGLVVTSALAAGFVLSSPAGEQQELAASALSVTTFTSNIYFGFARQGYFIPSSEFMPLLHTWSLGVEEQFYLGWPLLMWWCARMAKRGAAPAKLMVTLLGAGGACSLILSFTLLGRAELIAFYSFPTRAWELALGALLAYAPRLRGQRPKLGTTMVFGGLMLFVAVVVAHQSTTAFTGVPSFFGAISAGLIIAGGVLAPASSTTRLLGSRPMVAIGKLSYSWYLWHWVLLAFARAHALGAEHLGRDIALGIAALALAAITWRLVEQPVRLKRIGMFAADKDALKASTLILAVCAVLAGGLWLWAQHRLDHSPDGQIAMREASRTIRNVGPCEQNDPLPQRIAERCIIGSDTDGRLVLVLGDSHARHLVPGLVDAAEGANIRLLPLVKSSCLVQPFPDGIGYGVTRRHQAECAAFSNEILDTVPSLKERRLAGVILAGMWSRDGAWRTSLPPYLARLTSRGLRVVLVADTPGYRYSVPRCFALHGHDTCRGDRHLIDHERAAHLAALHQIASTTPGVAVWDPIDSLCTASHCEIFGGDTLLYTDAHHLSVHGSKRLAASMRPALEWVVGLDDAPPPR